MTIQQLRVARAAAALSAVLGLTACVTPQIKQSSTPAQAAPTSQNSAASAGPSTAPKPVASPQPTQAAPVNAVKPVENASTPNQSAAVASKAFQSMVEKELICAVKNSRLSIELIRKTAMSERLIAGKPTAVEGDSVVFAVKGNLTVYGLKVSELAFSGSAESDGSSVAVTLDATMADVVKAYKDNKIVVKKSSFGPGLWSKRPNSLFTGVYQGNGKLTMTCVEPMM